jgi:hypothetical protein
MKCFDGMACMMPGDCDRVGKCLADSAALANAADWEAWRAKRERHAERVQALRRALQWSVDHDGECLGDHPEQLAAARAALSGAEQQADAATLFRARQALGAARDALYNGFEPDNQSAAWHSASEALEELSSLPAERLARPIDLIALNAARYLFLRGEGCMWFTGEHRWRSLYRLDDEVDKAMAQRAGEPR